MCDPIKTKEGYRKVKDASFHCQLRSPVGSSTGDTETELIRLTAEMKGII